ncbi:hypothetical protein L1987_11770 [Smallanthus sonchifolius]|uniref:Uncharacterized protein n=1 Tax=Smallanthus sonchifolius TaxID=185202 RepID=A0ACB9JE57_9ASTR|nr:hypothetical protein L1987_11770 [Smallanthus sonchifolius]
MQLFRLPSNYMTVRAALNYDLDEETPADPNVSVTCEESIDHAIRSASISKYISRVSAQHSRVVHRFPMLIQLHRFLSILTLMKFSLLRKRFIAKSVSESSTSQSGFTSPNLTNPKDEFFKNNDFCNIGEINETKEISTNQLLDNNEEAKFRDDERNFDCYIRLGRFL